jgi:aminoglycoside 3-N-acetyltransferase
MTRTEDEARATFDGILTALGIAAGDTIMLGIDMARIPLPRYPAALTREALRERERKWCQFVLGALLDRLGTHGTLLVPAFSYSCSTPGSVFVAESTRSEVGPFTEYVRTRPAARRSLHPIFSLAGIGGHAESLLSRVGRSAFGALSPYARFGDLGVRFVGLGVELRHCLTYIHHLEQTYGCPHRFNKTFQTEVRAEGSIVPGGWYAYVAYRGLGFGVDLAGLQDALRAHGGLVCADWRGHPNQLAETAAVEAMGYQMLARDPAAFITRRLAFAFDDAAAPGAEASDRITLVITGRES